MDLVSARAIDFPYKDLALLIGYTVFLDVDL